MFDVIQLCKNLLETKLARFLVLLMGDHENIHVSLHRCFHGFTEVRRLREHEPKCVQFRPQGVRFPKDDMLYFKTYRKMVQVPAYIVAGKFKLTIQVKTLSMCV